LGIGLARLEIEVTDLMMKDKEEIADLSVSVIINMNNPEIAMLLNKIEQIHRTNAMAA